MFSGFPETLRQYGFKTDVRTLVGYVPHHGNGAGYQPGFII